MYPVTVGEVAYVKITDEPVFVVEIQPTDQYGETKVITRRKGDNGYCEEGFGLDELCSEKQRCIRELDFTLFALKQREKYSAMVEAERVQVPAQVNPSSGGSLLN